MRTDADRKFEAAIRKAFDEYAQEEFEGQVITDWLIVFTRQEVLESRIIYANSYTAPEESNPNTLMGMLDWAGGTMSDRLIGEVFDDDDE